MKKDYFIAAAFTLGLMVSPESLVFLGHLAGFTGLLFPAALVSALIIMVHTAWVYARQLQNPRGKGTEAFAMRTALGRPLALFFPLVSRVLTAICLSAALAVTAGFAFNEVFLRWFPNFAFAFGLLAVIVFLNLVGRGIAEKAQVIFVTTAIAGLAALTVGWIGGHPHVVPASSEAPLLQSAQIPLALLLFIGFEFGFFVGADTLRSSECRRAVVVALLAGITVCVFWGLASLGSVPREALADSTLPHMLAARAIFGQEGRAVMGIVVIAGASSGINALLAGTSRMVRDLMNHGLLPSFPKMQTRYSLLSVVLISACAAVLMGLGFAGEPVLDVAIRAGLLFWLLMYGPIHLSALILWGKVDRAAGHGRPGHVPFLSITSMTVFTLAFLWLLVTDERYPETLRFVASASGVGIAFSLMLSYMVRITSDSHG